MSDLIFFFFCLDVGSMHVKKGGGDIFDITSKLYLTILVLCLTFSSKKKAVKNQCMQTI